MAKRPNVLLVMADQLRADALGCYGNELCRTPNLDALAAAGVRFPNSFTPNPICVPARATLTTGNYSHACTGVKSNGGRIRDDQVKLAEHFASGGYETYACGKLHYVPYAPPGQPRLLHGFQHCDLTESGRYVWQHDPQYEVAASQRWWESGLAELHARYPTKPILVTEFGYPCLAGVFGSSLGEDLQAEVLHGEYAGMQAPYVCGATIWCWADHPWPEEDFINRLVTSPFGVVTRTRRPKAGLAVARTLFGTGPGIQASPHAGKRKEQQDVHLL